MQNLEKIFKKFSKNKIFIDVKGKHITYEDFYKKSAGFSLYLKKKDKSIYGKRIFLKMERSTNYFIAILGLCYLGVTIFPIPVKMPVSELNELRRKYKPHHEIDNLKFTKHTKNNINNKNLNNSKIIFFTSGTTGEPKGIVHKISNLLNSANKFSQLAQYKKNKRILHNWPHYYMAGFFNMFLCPFVTGSPIYFDEEININSYLKYWNNLLKGKINIAYLSPTMAQALISYSSYQRLNKKKIKHITIISTGSYLYNSTAKRFKELFGLNLINCYGITEVGGSISLEQKPYQTKKSIGKLHNSAKIKLSKNSEILVTSNYMFEGYLANYSTFIKFNDKYFNTGDLGEYKNGNIFIKGRSKEIIKKGGEQVSLLKIEDVALGFNKVEDVIARGISSEFWGEEIELDVIFRKNFNKIDTINKVEDLKKYLLQKLPKIYIPKRINSVKFIPKTSIGKNYRKIFN